MADYDDLTPEFLDGCPNGAPMVVRHTSAGSADVVDTATSSTDDRDFEHVWATNRHTSTVTLVLLLGGIVEPDNVLYSEPIEPGQTIALDGYPINNGLVLSAYASVADKITLSGYKWRRTG